MPDESRFYFSLPRLLVRNRTRSEKNFLEANVVALCIHFVIFIFAFRLLLGDRSFFRQLLLLLPLALLVGIGWLLLFYIDSLVIKALRAIGLMRDLSNGRAQSILIGIATSLCALALSFDRAPFNFIGMLWLILVTLNLVAAVILRNVSAAE